MHFLDEQHHPVNYSAPYEELIPDLEAAHELLIDSFIGEVAPPCIAKDLASLIRSLCHPDPRKRGLDKVSTKGDPPYNLHRVVGTLNTLYLRAKFDAQRQ